MELNHVRAHRTPRASVQGLFHHRRDTGELSVIWKCAPTEARKCMSGRERRMKTLSIIGFAVGAALVGCASTSSARSEPTMSAAPAPTHQHDHGGADQGGMMAGMCPMQVSGTTVAATDVEGGIGLVFTTKGGDVAELRQRVRRMAEMHNGRGGHMGAHTMMGGHGAPSAGADAEHQHSEEADAGHERSGRGGMMMTGGMMTPAATASVEDIEGGARLVLRPKDPAQLAALRAHVHMKAERMAGGQCPMMSLGGGQPGQPDSNPGVADHDAHHPGK